MLKISVIVPIYNVENYIHRCIDSILAQTFTDFELILVDDGSPDNCGKICDEYAKKDSRINVIHKENGGLSSARNAGLDIASGDYIVFVDSDDYVEKELLETGVSILRKNSGVLVSFGFLTEGENNGKKKEFVGYLPTNVEFKTNKEKALFIINEICDYRIPWSAWSKFYSREIIEKYKLRFADNRMIFAEDFYFSLCYFSFVNKIISIKKPMYHYITRDNSIMGKDVKKRNTSRFEKLAESVYCFYSDNKDSSYMMKYFPLLYYKIINHALTMDLKLDNVSNYIESKTIMQNEIKNMKLFRSNINKAWKIRKYLHNDYTLDFVHEERISMLKYFGDSNKISYKVRNKLISFKCFRG